MTESTHSRSRAPAFQLTMTTSTRFSIEFFPVDISLVSFSMSLTTCSTHAAPRANGAPRFRGAINRFTLSGALVHSCPAARQGLSLRFGVLQAKGWRSHPLLPADGDTVHVQAGVRAASIIILGLSSALNALHAVARQMTQGNRFSSSEPLGRVFSFCLGSA